MSGQILGSHLLSLCPRHPSRFSVAGRLGTLSRWPTFPYSFGTFLRRWQQTLTALGLPLLWTPAGLRAGAATWLYRLGTPIDYIRLRGRWRAPSSLERYIQEAAAFAVMQQPPEPMRAFVRARAETLWQVVEEALNELAGSFAAGDVAIDALDLIVRPHPSMRRFLRQRKLRE